MTPRLLIVLAPPRSFSSVVAAVLGQHPEMYGLPELNLFIADTIGARHRVLKRAGAQARHGLLRTLAELHDGTQTESTIDAAERWLADRSGWSARAVFEHILDQVSPRIAVDKSPRTVMRRGYLERAYRMFPDALFLHLTRHPRSAALSQINITSRNETWGGRLDAGKINPDRWWLNAQNNITAFLATVPEGQWLRVKGEDVLSEPDQYLPQIAEWLGLRTDAAALAAMKHPENSPYACFGPENAKYGNDYNFLENPVLKNGRVQDSSLIGPLEWAPERTFAPELIEYAHCFGYR